MKKLTNDINKISNEINNQDYPYDDKPYGFLGFLHSLAFPFILLFNWFKKKFNNIKTDPKGSFKKLGLVIISPLTWLFKKLRKWYFVWDKRVRMFIKHPKSFLKGLSSLIIPGSGHAYNKKWKRAALFFAIFLIFLSIELNTGRYMMYFSEIADFPAEDGKLYFWRDYGGFFGKGLWGLFTMGKLVIGDSYRGVSINLIDYELPWASADNSAQLLGQGIISLVFFVFVIAFYNAQIKDAWKVDRNIEEGTDVVEPLKEYLRRTWDQYFAYILVVPALILLMIFTIVPFLFSFLIAFTSIEDVKIFPTIIAEWDFFATFKSVFSDSSLLRYFWDVLKWTIFYAVMSSITVYIIGFIHAMILNSNVVKRKKAWRIVMILPWAIPGMISLMVFRQMFDGSVSGFMNQSLLNYGMLDNLQNFFIKIGFVNEGYAGGESIVWFGTGNGGLAKTVILIVNLWLGSPYFMMLILGILGTIPLSLYEAASIDGAKGSQKFRFITLPWVLKATTPIIITTFTFNFNNFGAIYFLTGGGPTRVGIPPDLNGRLQIIPGDTDILISWIYKISFGGANPEYNVAAVYSILIFIGISSIAIWSLARVKSFWEED